VDEYDKTRRGNFAAPLFPEKLMNRGTGTFVAMLVCALLAVVVFFLVDLSGDKVFATPQEAFDESCLALKKKDMRGWCQCFTDDSRDFIAANMAVQEFKTKQIFAQAGDGEKKAHIRAVEQVFAKHGLTDEFLAKLQGDADILGDSRARMKQKVLFAKEVIKPVNDRCAFIADMFEAVLKNSNEENPILAQKDDKLGDVTITGEIAMGLVTPKLGGPPRQLFFHKQGEGWRIDFLAEDKRPMPGLPPGHP
jgi:hypothetical protein